MQGKGLVILIYSPSCSACQKFFPEFEKISLPKFTVNALTNPPPYADFVDLSITRVPTIIFLKNNFYYEYTEASGKMTAADIVAYFKSL